MSPKNNLEIQGYRSTLSRKKKKKWISNLLWGVSTIHLHGIAEMPTLAIFRVRLPIFANILSILTPKFGNLPISGKLCAIEVACNFENLRTFVWIILIFWNALWKGHNISDFLQSGFPLQGKHCV